MTLDDFEKLDYNASLQVINRGSCLGVRQEGKHTIFLYGVDRFYVEVYYLGKYSHITGFRAFEETEYLNFYFGHSAMPDRRSLRLI